MKKTKPLDYKKLRRELNPKELSFDTTKELSPLNGFIGQTRAYEATIFGVTIKSFGYNMFVMGPAGIGKHSLTRNLLKNYAKTQPVPPDWCYIFNFDAPEKPIAIKLPAGMGMMLKKDMAELLEELTISILTVFESDEYRLSMNDIQQEFNEKREVLIQSTGNLTTLEIPHLYRERHEKEKVLQINFMVTLVQPHIQKLKLKYAEHPRLINYFKAVQKDILLHINDFVKKEETSGITYFDVENPLLVRYQVNLFVNNSSKRGAPVVFEENPSYANLICRIEYKPQAGTLTTDFTLIRPGSLHRANGGYLIIDARKLKREKNAWEALKNALYNGKIKIEPAENITESVHPVSLKPKSIELDIKVILLGERGIYYKLCKHDSEFNELFKVVVDFDEQIPRSKENIQIYARLISTFIKRDRLKHFAASAVAAIIDYSSRLAEDIEKLSTHIRRINDLVQESNYWASQAKKQVVEADDVKKAIENQIYRLDRSRQIYFEDIERDFILILTDKAVIGQVNCLSVVRVGKYAYGHPTRITAKVRLGRGNFIDIQREIKLAGPIHSKAGLTIANYLADRYCRDYLYSLTASISFEQIYGMLEGDSASVAELCILLSAIAKIPLKQSLAITGSLNQYGDVQAVGGINEKIEGYFDICKRRGLTGQQGVIIPAINAKTLMLKDEIVKAAQAKQFFIYPINTVDEALYLLTDLPPGERNRKGEFPKNSFNEKVESALIRFASLRHRYKKDS